MIRPTKDVYLAFSRLGANADFMQVMKWLEDSFAEQKDVNIDLKGEDGIRGQGKAEILRDITNSFNQSREALKRCN